MVEKALYAHNFSDSSELVDARTGNVSYTFPILENFVANGTSGPDISFKLTYSNSYAGLPTAYGINWQDNFTKYDRFNNLLILYTGEKFHINETDNEVSIIDATPKNIKFTKINSNEYYVRYIGGRIEKLSNPIDVGSPIKLTTNIFSTMNAEVKLDWKRVTDLSESGSSNSGYFSYRLGKISQRKSSDQGMENYTTILRLAITDDTGRYAYSIFPDITDKAHTYVIKLLNRDIQRIISSYEGVLWQYYYTDKRYTNSESSSPVQQPYHSLKKVTTSTGIVDTITYNNALMKSPTGEFPPFPMPNKHERKLPGNEYDLIRQYTFGKTDSDSTSVFKGSPRTIVINLGNYLGHGSSVSPENTRNNNYLYYTTDNYVYVTTERQFQRKKGKSTFEELRCIERTYNRFHLLTKQVITPSKSNQSDRIETEISYNSTNTGTFSGQPDNFANMKSQTISWVSGGQMRTSKLTTEFDKDGLLTKEISPTGVTTEYEYYTEEELPSADGMSRFIKTITTDFGSDIPKRREAIDYQYISVFNNDQTNLKNTSMIVPDSKKQYESFGTTTGAYNLILSHDYTYISGSDKLFNGSLLGEKLEHFTPGSPVPNYTKEIHLSWSDNSNNYTVVATSVQDQVMTSTTFDKFYGSILEETDGNGNVVRYSYNTFGEVTQKEVAMPGQPNRITQYVYDIISNTLTTTSPSGIKERITFDRGLREIKLEKFGTNNRFNTIRQYSYNADGIMLEDREIWSETVDGLTTKSIKTTYTPHFFGGYSKITYPTAIEQHFTRHFVTDTNAFIVESTYKNTDGTLVDTLPTNSVEFDISGKIIKQTSVAPGLRDRQILYEYDKLGRQTKLITPDQSKWLTSYDSFGNVLSKTLPNGGVIKNSYDSSGNSVPKTITMDDILIASNEFDNLGRITLREVGGVSQSFGYNKNFLEPVSETMEDGQARSYEYHRGLLTTVNQFDSGLTGEGTLKKMRTFDKTLGTIDSEEVSYGETNPRKVRQKYNYDTLGRAISETTSYENFPSNIPSSHTKTWQYPASDNRVLNSSHALAQTETYGYDSFGRIQTVSFYYNGKWGELTKSYDSFNRLISDKFTVDNLVKEEKTQYDGFGSIKQTDVTFWIGGVQRYSEQVSYSYNDSGKIIFREIIKNHKENGITPYVTDEKIVYSYDMNGRLTKESMTYSQERLYPKDSMGISYKEIEYNWDQFDRIVSQTITNLQNQTITTSFSYKTTKLFQINSINRAGKSYTVGYDAVGRIISTSFPTTKNFSYDGSGQLKTVSEGNTLTYNHYYDSTKRLAYRSLNNDGYPRYTPYYISTTLVGAHYQEGQEKKTDISYFPLDRPWLKKESLVDQGTSTLSETVGNLDLKNTPISSSKYINRELQPFSDEIYNSTGNSNKTDNYQRGMESQLLSTKDGEYFMGAGRRNYSPGLGQFLTPDPYTPFSGGGINPYLYALADPINNSDPSGYLSTTAWALIGIGLFAMCLVAPLAIGFALASGAVGAAAIAIAGVGVGVAGGFMLHAGLVYDSDPQAAYRSVLYAGLISGGSVASMEAVGSPSSGRRVNYSSFRMKTMGALHVESSEIENGPNAAGTFIDISSDSESPRDMITEAVSMRGVELLSIFPENRMLALRRPISTSGGGNQLVLFSHGLPGGMTYPARTGLPVYSPADTPNMRMKPPGSIDANEIGSFIQQRISNLDTYKSIRIYSCYSATGNRESLAYNTAKVTGIPTYGFEGAPAFMRSQSSKLLDKFNAHFANPNIVPSSFSPAEQSSFADEIRTTFANNDIRISNRDTDFRLGARLFDCPN